MIKYYNRNSKKYEIEKIAGDKSLNWIYSSQSGMFFLEKIVKKKLFSKIYGMYCDSTFSKSKINKFINNFNINMKNFKEPTGGFRNFNDFFYRKLSKTARPVDQRESSLVSPGDGKIKVFTHIDINSLIQVKGFTYNLKSLIKNNKIANNYKDGTCIILRLCPTDYHRFHFLDSGICGATTKIKGSYYSVNPIALNKINNIFCENKREWSVFHSDNFSDVLYIEVGATCVGSIIQTYPIDKKVSKGDEKGYFKFGGSTIVLFFKNNTIKIDEDILTQSNEGYETQVSMGEKIGMNL